MMGFAHNNTKIKVEQQPLEAPPVLKKSEVSLDQSFIEFEDYPDSFLDSLLNFDGWVEDHLSSSVAEVMNSEQKPNLEIKKEEEEVCETEKLGDLGSLIQEGMGRVCLTSGVDGLESSEVTGGDVEVKSVNESEVKNDTEKVGDDLEESKDSDSDSDSEEESSSSSSSSSSSDEDNEEEDDDDDDDEDEEEDEKEIKKEVEMEEGEIREEMVSWSEDEDVGVAKGPIRSKNEVQNLPPVPPVNVTIEPHHQTLPVGVILSIIGSQVIVEGVENHNPLSEGSILWITESRSPLGVVDEIFGPVKNPYYMVRYNLESEVPTGIQQGSSISFVPEFADYVLNNNNLYKKGYDASGENDEELSDEVEFSDDEKEAEYKKMIKMSKRGLNEQKNGNMKKDKKSRNRGGNGKNDHQPSGGPTSGPGMSPAFSPGPLGPPNFSGPSSGVWPNGFPSIPPQNIGFPPNVPFMQQNFIQQPFPNLGLPNLAPFHPQFNNTGQMFPTNFIQNVPPNFVQNGPPNFGGNPAFTSWPAGMNQNNFNQPQVRPPPMAFPGFSTPPMNVLPMGNLQMENNGATRPSFVAGNVETSQNPNEFKQFPNGGGRGGRFQRGGGRFRGGRGGPRTG